MIVAVCTLREKLKNLMDNLLQVAIENYPAESVKEYVDRFPYFAFHVNFKKSLYENLLQDLYINNQSEIKRLENEFCDMLSQTGIVRSNTGKELVFRKIKDFLSDKTPYVRLDMEQYDQYVSAIESFLSYSTNNGYDKLIIYLFSVSLPDDTIFINQEPVKLYTKSSGTYLFDMALSRELDNTEDYEDYFWDTKNDDTSLWLDYGYVASAGELERAFLEAKKIVPIWQPLSEQEVKKIEQREKEIKPDRKYISIARTLKENLYSEDRKYQITSSIFLDIAKDTQYMERLKNYVDLVIDLLLSPLFNVPERVVVDTLQSVCDKLLCIAFDSQISKLAANKGVTKKDIARECHIDKTRFSNALSTYGESMLRESDIDKVSEYFGLPLQAFSL